MKKIKILFFYITFLFFLIHLNKSKIYSIVNIDIHGAYATTPSNLVSNIDYNFHSGIGIGIDIFRIQPWIMWQFRMDYDIHLFKYKEQPFQSNFPLGFGSRFVFGGGVLPRWLVFYLDLAYILRIKRDIVAGDFQYITHSFALGIGVEFFAFKFFYMGLFFKAHMIDMYYFYAGPFIGFRL